MKRIGKIVGRGQHRLPGIAVGWIGRELAHAVEERRQRASHALSGIRKNPFDLVQRVELGLGIALLLRLFVDSQLQQFIANALKLLQGYSAAEGYARFLEGWSLVQYRDLAAVSRRVYVGDVVGGDVQRSLIGLQGLDCDG